MTVAAFLDILQQRLSLPHHQSFTILAGFPPKPVLLPDDRSNTTLASLQVLEGYDASMPARNVNCPQLSNGESITVQLEAAPTNGTAARAPVDADEDADEDADLARAIAASLADAHAPPPAAPVQQQGNGASFDVPLANGTVMTRRVIDSDNSCLFNAVGYVMEHSRTQSTRLRCGVLLVYTCEEDHHDCNCRRVIADAVINDPLTYTDGFLGKEPEAYCTWIQQPSSWGGGIELSILARLKMT